MGRLSVPTGVSLAQQVIGSLLLMQVPWFSQIAIKEDHKGR
jgi:hypothetical protein